MFLSLIKKLKNILRENDICILLGRVCKGINYTDQSIM